MFDRRRAGRLIPAAHCRTVGIDYADGHGGKVDTDVVDAVRVHAPLAVVGAVLAHLSVGCGVAEIKFLLGISSVAVGGNLEGRMSSIVSNGFETYASLKQHGIGGTHRQRGAEAEIPTAVGGVTYEIKHVMFHRQCLVSGLTDIDGHVGKIACHGVVRAFRYLELIVVAAILQASVTRNVCVGRGIAVFGAVPLRFGQEFEFFVGVEIASVGEYLGIVACLDHYSRLVEAPATPRGITYDKQLVDSCGAERCRCKNSD